MTFDLPEELRRAAGPLPALDDSTFATLRVRRRRHDLWLAPVVSVTIATILVTAAALLLPDTRSEVRLDGVDSSPESTEPTFAQIVPDSAEPPVSSATARSPEPTPPSQPSPAPADVAPTPKVALDPPAVMPERLAKLLNDAPWNVLASQSTQNVSTARGYVVTDQAVLERRWRETLGLQGPAPVLPEEQGALLVLVGGTCDGPEDVLGVEGIVNDDGSAVFAAIQLDPACAQLGRSGTTIGPPYALWAIGIPEKIAEGLSGTATVIAPVAEYPWRLAYANEVATAVDNAVAKNQADLDRHFADSGLPGQAPELGNGQGAYVVGVPGTCTDAADVREVDTVANIYHEGSPTDVLTAIYFDRACAQLYQPDVPEEQDAQPHSVFVFTAPLPVVESAGGTHAYVACGPGPVTDPVPCSDPKSNAVHVLSTILE